ncbi:MAG: tail fiber domain-containing protein [Saprospiraceae bacterium]|nr:tail fiber domain-containing protein [Saprospiraceae bacterium]
MKYSNWHNTQYFHSTFNHLNIMHIKTILTTILMVSVFIVSYGQQRVGINTTTPVRPLEIYGNGEQYLRVHSSTASNNRVGIEFIRGDDDSNARDWKIENWDGNFKILTGTDNFATLGDHVLHISEDGLVGIGTTSPVTRLHVDGGEDASNTLDGYLMLGTKTGNNLIMDQNEIMARLNGAPSTLYIQTGGGNTWFAGGDVFMGSGGGKVSIGGAPLSERFNINGSLYQVQLRNPLDGMNDWYIGASNASWQTGDDLLCFSPNTGQLNSTLRLKRVTENNGSEAPVMITSPSTQTLFFDGNEIDSNTPLYINHNSDEETYINPSGGKVGVGTSNPDGVLTVKTTEFGLGVKRDFGTWWISPTSTGVVNFWKNTDLLAYFSYDNGGDWIAVSDRNLKENIRGIGSVMENINKVRLTSYSFIHDPASRKDIGVIAQELEPLFPEAVSYNNGQYGVSYDQLTVIGIKGIQEQQSRLEDLNRKLDSMLYDK